MASPTIHEVKISDAVTEGARGGLSWRTRIAIAASGKEKRIGRWVVPRAQYSIDYTERSPTEFDELLAFWLAREGPLNGFRFKDWIDYTVTNAPLATTGAPTVQLTKTYTSGAFTHVRDIYKPVSSPASTLRKNTSPFAGFTLNVTTGIVTFTVLNSKAITGITLGSTTLITFGSAHSFVVGDLIYFTGIVGTTQLNGTVGEVTVINTPANTIRVAINSTSYTAWVSGGTAANYMNDTDVFDWTGEFDVPVRFDMDEPDFGFDEALVRSWSNIRLIEMVG